METYIGNKRKLCTFNKSRWILYLDTRHAPPGIRQDTWNEMSGRLSEFCGMVEDALVEQSFVDTDDGSCMMELRYADEVTVNTEFVYHTKR